MVDRVGVFLVVVGRYLLYLKVGVFFGDWLSLFFLVCDFLFIEEVDIIIFIGVMIYGFR